jgi:uncharacterized protein YjiK
MQSRQKKTIMKDHHSTEIKIIKKWDLPSSLREISGLSVLDEKRLVCVEDESGKIYIYNTANEKVEREIIFAATGDFEGVTVVGTDIWVLRADGVLFEIKNIWKAVPTVIEHDTHLTAEQDCEGLCYDLIANRLLVTIKEKDPNSPDYKGIYAFDLSTRSMDEKPAFKIDLNHSILKLKKNGKKKKEEDSVRPSGIAIHPTTGEMYITDGPASKLLITDSKGDIKKYIQLDEKIFTQPEGIAFNARGDLFIANEGLGRPGNIVQLKLPNC